MNKRAIVTDRERQLVEGRGGIMEMKQTIADREAEIERLRELLQKVDACLDEKEVHWHERIEDAQNMIFDALKGKE